jgi:hypothetical protein
LYSFTLAAFWKFSSNAGTLQKSLSSPSSVCVPVKAGRPVHGVAAVAEGGQADEAVVAVELLLPPVPPVLVVDPVVPPVPPLAVLVEPVEPPLDSLLELLPVVPPLDSLVPPIPPLESLLLELPPAPAPALDSLEPLSPAWLPPPA